MYHIFALFSIKMICALLFLPLASNLIKHQTNLYFGI